MIHQTRKKNLVRKLNKKINLIYRLNKEIKNFTEGGDKGGKKIILIFIYI